MRPVDDDLGLADWLDHETELARHHLDTSSTPAHDASTRARHDAPLLRDGRPALIAFEARVRDAITILAAADLTFTIDRARAALLQCTDPELELIVLAATAADRIDWTGHHRPTRRALPDLPNPERTTP